MPRRHCHNISIILRVINSPRNFGYAAAVSFRYRTIYRLVISDSNQNRSRVNERTQVVNPGQ